MSFYDSTRTATAEYPQDRLHLMPDWRAVADPFHARADAWQINMPHLDGDDEPAAQWWPAEHYARAGGGILQLSEQTVMLRRDKDVLLATAAELKPAARIRRGDTATTVLVRTTAPHVIESSQHQTFSNGSRSSLPATFLRNPRSSARRCGPRRSGELSARTRFGVTPPAPLSALRPGETAISDPVLIAVDGAAPTNASGALHQMLGSTRVTGPKVGVYWETYGYAPGDSIDVAVVIVRHE